MYDYHHFNNPRLLKDHFEKLDKIAAAVIVPNRRATDYEGAVRAVPVEWIEQAEELVLCANCVYRGNPEECPLLKDIGVAFHDDYCCCGYRDDDGEEGGGGD